MDAASLPSLNVLDAAAILREEADRHIEGRIRALPQGGAEISCRAGCCACCRQLVVVSPLEAAAIAGYLASRPEFAARVSARTEVWRAAVDALPELAASLRRFAEHDGYLPGDEGGALEEAYWEAQLPCPFLEDNRCSIYPVRPFGCREHHVLSSPDLCSTDLSAPVPAGTRMEYRAVGNWVGSHAFALADRLIPLPAALAECPEAPAEAAPENEVRAHIAEGQRRTRFAMALLMAAEKRHRAG